MFKYFNSPSLSHKIVEHYFKIVSNTSNLIFQILFIRAKDFKLVQFSFPLWQKRLENSWTLFEIFSTLYILKTIWTKKVQLFSTLVPTNCSILNVKCHMSRQLELKWQQCTDENPQPINFGKKLGEICFLNFCFVLNKTVFWTDQTRLIVCLSNHCQLSKLLPDKI